MPSKPTKDQKENDRSVSPVGWYVASYILRFIELDDTENDNPEAEFLVWENTILVKAADMDEAHKKATRVAMEGTEPYKGGPERVDVQWVFEGITELLPIYEEIEDGSEIMWGEHEPQPLRDIRKLVREKSELFQ